MCFCISSPKEALHGAENPQQGSRVPRVPRGPWNPKNRRVLTSLEKKTSTATPVFGNLFLMHFKSFQCHIFSRSKDHLLLTIWFNAGGFQPSNGVTLGIESHHGRHRWPSTGCTYQTPSEALGVDKGYSSGRLYIVAYRCISYSTNLDTVPTWYDAFMSSLCHSLCTCLLIKTVLTTISHFSPTLATNTYKT